MEAQLDPRSLASRLSGVTPPIDDSGASGSLALDRLLHGKPLEAVVNQMALLPGAASLHLHGFLSGVFGGSDFLSRIAARDPVFFGKVLCDPLEPLFDDVLTNARSDAIDAKTTKELMAGLRRAKAKVALSTALADLGGVWSVEAVTARLSQAAQVFVSSAVDFLLTQAARAGHYLPAHSTSPSQKSGLIILGMGKFGANELNYSSDIDLIIFYESDGIRIPAGKEPQAFFVRLARDLVHILQEQTADGYVFRTDLRLRPDPGSTQAAISTTAAYYYYETLGQNWERAAYIKARPIAGDLEAGTRFLAGLEPYIWRRYLDYNAITDIHAMKRQIHAAKGHTQIAVAGHNIKLGRGGIREIEFFVQSQQLIGGGRQPLLQSRGTLDALNRLVEFEWIAPSIRDDLRDAYCFLRRIEHRLQMVADQQTHTLPSSPDDLSRFARFAGYRELQDFERDLCQHMQAVQTHYASLFESVPELTPTRVQGNLVFTGDADDPATVDTLRRLGFKNPSGVIALVKGWHFGRYRSMRSVRAREILTEFTPVLLEALAETADPDLGISTLDTFLREIPAALQLFSMLRANPPLLKLLAEIMGSAPRLARILSKRRRVMDAVLDPGFLGIAPTRAELLGIVYIDAMRGETYEGRLNRTRVNGQEQAFAVGVGLLSRTLTAQGAGEAYSLLADVVIETLVDAVQAEFGRPDLPAPAVITMGKLGGREMTAASDLDLIVVYEATNADAPQHYARFTQRLIAALSAQTAEGNLYDVDMRLRPSGNAGPLAVHIEGFAAYQRDQAWTWEHMALTRARVVAGSPDLQARLSRAIDDILRHPRNVAKTTADVREMRARIAKEKGTAEIWDTRNHAGGLLDIEFITQYLQLIHAAAHPEVLSQNTLQSLRNLACVNLAALHDTSSAEFQTSLSSHDTDALISAAELYQTIAKVLRLCTDGRFNPASAAPGLIALLLEITGEPDLSRLEARLAENYALISKIFANTLHE